MQMVCDQRTSMAPFISAAIETTHFRSPATPVARPITWHACLMHAVTSEFMRSTPAPQVLRTTSLAVKRLLDAAGHRA